MTRWAGRALADYVALAGVLLLLVFFFGLLNRNFWSVSTLVLVVNQVPDLTVIAVGMTFVLIVAGIDLSVGSVVGFSSAVLGVAFAHWGDHAWLAGGGDLTWWGQAIVLVLLAPLLCALAGAVCGLINGAVSVGWAVPSFIVTLGMMLIARGGAAILTNSRTMYIGSSIEPVSAPLPVVRVAPAFLVALAIVVMGEFVLRKTVFGRYAIAIGGNEEAARLSGIRTGRIKIAIFVFCGALAGLAGLFQSSKLASANPEAGVDMELSAIAAVVIGGTSLMGGRGSVVNSFFGVLIIAVLQSGLAQINAEDSHKRVITGIVIVVAVVLDVYRGRLRGAS
jgi:ribose transport system permease protein